MSTTQKANTLGKAAKLKSRKQIELLFAEGKGFTAFPVKVVYLVQKNNDPETDHENATVQVGVSVSTRHFKHATDRNRIKRLLREAYRQQKHELVETAGQKGLGLSVFFIYLDKTMPDYDLLFDKMRYCLKRLRKILEELP
jgi:ribonuclease P protein component